MKIRKLQLKNIGVFDDETIEFQKCPEGKAEIHIFTGQNGSGKTTILQALASAFYSTPGFHEKLDRKKLIKEVSRMAHSKNPRDRVSFFEEFKRFLESEERESKKNIPIKNLTESKIFNHLHSKFRNPNSYHFRNRDDSFALISTEDYGLVSVYSCHLCQSTHVDGKRYFEEYSRAILSENLPDISFSFAIFAFSGYRQIQSEKVDAMKQPNRFNPLSQSLEFVKDYLKENELTINQLIANNISNRALSKEDGSLEEAKRYEAVINTIESFIKDVVGYELKFVLKRQPNELKLKIYDEEFDFDVLPDGLRSLISWIADLLGRVDLLKWQDNLPIFEKNLILLLDEIEVHLHPAWQRKVLPVVQKLFKNSQIFVSTHSPFVVNSVDDAWVYKLELENGKAKVADVVKSENSYSITQVLREIFGIDKLFGEDVRNKLNELERLRDKILSNGSSKKDEEDLLKIARSLAKEPSDQVKQIVRGELQQLSEIKGKKFSI